MRSVSIISGSSVCFGAPEALHEVAILKTGGIDYAAIAACNGGIEDPPRFDSLAAAERWGRMALAVAEGRIFPPEVAAEYVEWVDGCPRFPPGWSAVLVDLGDDADQPNGTMVPFGRDKFGFVWGDIGSLMVPTP